MAMWNDYEKLARRLDRIANAFERIADALEADHKDEPFKTTEYCNYCNHKGCENCIANNLDDYCVPSNFEEAVKDKPQLKEDGELEILTQTIEFPDTHQRFMFTRSIRADGDCLIIGDWEYKGKEDEPQAEGSE